MKLFANELLVIAVLKPPVIRRLGTISAKHKFSDRKKTFPGSKQDSPGRDIKNIAFISSIVLFSILS